MSMLLLFLLLHELSLLLLIDGGVSEPGMFGALY